MFPSIPAHGEVYLYAYSQSCPLTYIQFSVGYILDIIRDWCLDRLHPAWNRRI